VFPLRTRRSASHGCDDKRLRQLQALQARSPARRSIPTAPSFLRPPWRSSSCAVVVRSPAGYTAVDSLECGSFTDVKAGEGRVVLFDGCHDFLVSDRAHERSDSGNLSVGKGKTTLFCDQVEGVVELDDEPSIDRIRLQDAVRRNGAGTGARVAAARPGFDFIPLASLNIDYPQLIVPSGEEMVACLSSAPAAPSLRVST
jgi:hypothetical protein